VTKNELMLTSLVGAIPGALLSTVVVMLFLNHAGGWGLPKGISAATLLISVCLTLMPAAIWLRYGPRPAKKTESAAKATSAPASEAEVEVEAEALSGESAVATLDSGSEEFDLGAEFEEDPEKK
jgi:hypothetical protein